MPAQLFNLTRLTRFQTLQALVHQHLPNGRPIPEATAIRSLSVLLPIIILANAADKKTLQDFKKLEEKDPFILEWINEVEEIDNLVNEGIKMSLAGL